MPLVHPQYIVLDSATLGKVSLDYWSQCKIRREKSQTFIKRLQDNNVFVTLTLIHVLELLGHENESVVNDRISFMRRLPFIAWLRPYDQSWFPGGIPDLLKRELHAVVHDSKRKWSEIIKQVRINLWETGVGSELFINDNQLWTVLQRESQRQQQIGQYISSVARTDPGNVENTTVAELKQMSIRSESTRATFIRNLLQL